MSDTFYQRRPTARDIVFHNSNNEAEAIAAAKTLAPRLYRLLVGIPLIKAPSPPVVILAMLLTWASTKYGFGWSEATVNVLTMVITGLAAYGMRLLTEAPITGIIKVPPPPAAPAVTDKEDIMK